MVLFTRRIHEQRCIAGAKAGFPRSALLATASTVLLAGLGSVAQANGPDTAVVRLDTICSSIFTGKDCFPAKAVTETKTVKVGDMLPRAGIAGIWHAQGGFWVTKVDSAGIEVLYSAKAVGRRQTGTLRINYGRDRVLGEYEVHVRITAKKGATKGTADVTMTTKIQNLEAAPPKKEEPDTCSSGALVSSSKPVSGSR